MNNIEKRYMKQAYIFIMFVALLSHIFFAISFAVYRVAPMAIYNMFSIVMYIIFLLLVWKDVFRTATVMAHYEICLFSVVSTIVLGWSYNFAMYIVATTSLAFFNPFKRKWIIFVITASEIVIYAVLYLFSMRVDPLIYLEQNADEIYSFSNSLACLGIIMVVGIVSRMTTDRIEKSSYHTSHDELTGLYNRAYFFEQVEEELKRHANNKYYILCTDIADFKLYNELFGEEKGNEVLLAQADSMRASKDMHSVYGRLSGDEFAMLVEDATYDEDQIEKHTIWLQEQFSNDLYKMHIYVGVYEVTDYTESVSTMCEKAHIAISSIKGQFDIHFAHYDDSMLEKNIIKRKIIGEFDKALENHEFCIFLQPQVKKDGVILGAEALVRWIRPDGSMVSPGEFIPVLEETGLITKLDLYVWELAVKTLRKWKEEGREDFHISVNVSGKDFYHVDIYKKFTELVEQYDINPGNLKIEITETVFMHEIRQQMGLLQKLRTYGFEIEMDDFGSGYSSLNMLKDMVVDVLKIDMGFLETTEHMDRSWGIIETIIELAYKLNMKIITEGVETAEQVKNLEERGCRMYQGYYFAKPMDVPLFESTYFNA